MMLITVPGDRVEYFRAQAAMQRWQEEWELKQAELLHAIRSFRKMCEVWNSSATMTSSEGRKAYALCMALNYEWMARDIEIRVIKSHHGHILPLLDEGKDGHILADVVAEDCKDPEAALRRTSGT
jgi:hypothetical protein